MSVSWGGSEELWFLLAKSLLKQGHIVKICVFKHSLAHPKVQELKVLGAQIYLRRVYFSNTSILKRLIAFAKKLIFSRFELKSFLKKDFDHLIISQGAAFDIAYSEYYYSLKNIKKKYSLIVQGNSDFSVLNSITRQRAKLIFENAIKVFFVSKRNKESAIRQLISPINNSEIIRNGINLDLSQIVNLSFPDTPVLTMAIVSRLDCNGKGHHLLISNLSSPQWKNRNWELNIYGDGPDKEYLEQLVNFYSLSEKVKFRGFINSIEEVWQKNKILILPTFVEGMSLAMIEAAFCYRPSLISDVGGSAEFIDHLENGFLLDFPTNKLIHQNLELIWKNKGKLEEMGMRAGKKIYSWYKNKPENTIINNLSL